MSDMAIYRQLRNRPDYPKARNIVKRCRFTRFFDGLTTNSTYVDIIPMARKPNNSVQTRKLVSAMLRQPRAWQYGYELSKQTGLKSGTLYPLLIRLSDQGLLESKWQEPERPGKPPRHAYKLTSTGLAFARETTATNTGSTVRRKLVGATT
jgi:PadR family transcriptional regulator PadR